MKRMMNLVNTFGKNSPLLIIAGLFHIVFLCSAVLPSNSFADILKCVNSSGSVAFSNSGQCPDGYNLEDISSESTQQVSPTSYQPDAPVIREYPQSGIRTNEVPSEASVRNQAIAERSRAIAEENKKLVGLEKQQLEEKYERVGGKYSNSTSDPAKRAVAKEIEQLERNPEQYFYDKEQREKRNNNYPATTHRPPPVPQVTQVPQNIYANPGGAVDNQGNHYNPAGDGNLVRGNDGTVMQRQGNWYLDTRTGQMVPAQ